MSTTSQFLQTSNLQRTKNKYKLWPEIYFLAEAEREPFTEVVVVTANAYRKDKAIEEAFALGATIANVDRIAEKLLRNYPVEQFVEVFDTNILVVLDVPEINDLAVDKALMMLAEVPKFKTGNRTTFNNVLHKITTKSNN